MARKLWAESLEQRLMLSAATNPVPGDVNLDGVVNGQDVALVSSNWLKTTPQPLVGDVNSDGIVNGQDIAVISSNWLAKTAAPHMLFDSEFSNPNELAVGSSLWTTASPFGQGTASNATPGEVQEYIDTQGGSTDGPNPFAFTANGLTITAQPTAGLGAGLTYSSGSLSTLGLFSFTHGYVEMKAQMPGGKGFWPSFQLFGDPMVGTPEVDISQFSSQFPTEHYPALLVNTGTSSNPNVQEVAGAFVSAPGGGNLSAAMHTYGLEWTATGFTWYLDGVQVMSSATVVNQPLFLTVNFAVGDGGGEFVGNPDGSTQQLTIRYIRVWNQKP